MPLLEMQSLIDEFDVGPLTISRRSAPVRNAYGEMVAATSAAVVLAQVAVHNASGKDRQMLPQSIRDNETIEVYSKVQVYSGNDGQASDVLSYLSRNWVCVQTLDYALNGGVFISFWQLEASNR